MKLHHGIMTSDILDLLGGSSQLVSGEYPLFISHFGHLEGEQP